VLKLKKKIRRQKVNLVDLKKKSEISKLPLLLFVLQLACRVTDIPQVQSYGSTGQEQAELRA